MRNYLKILRSKRFRKPKKKNCAASATQAHVWCFEKYNSNWLTAQTAQGYSPKQYLKQIMHVTELVNKML